ncbi:MAG: lysophospholipase [Chloroflexi bacterium]|nr:MAG: lysophospholipase [Chloroflexota bacterium]
MTHRTETFAGSREPIVVHVWDTESPRRIALIAHGYAEHSGRYAHVAAALVSRGATVWSPDHHGHGLSGGERAVIVDFEEAVDDLHHVASMARDAHPNLPVVLIGHSMGGLIAARYAQRYGDELAGLVLSGPLVGRHEFAEALLSLPELPEIELDPGTLSRDPAVGEAYLADPLVYNGPFRRAMLEAMRSGLAAIEAGPGFGGLPTLYLHGGEDALVPLAISRPAIERLGGADFTARVYEDAKHEIFNETNQREVLDDVCAFADRVTPRGG